MRTYKTKWFARFAKKQDVEDSELLDAVKNAEKDLIDADLGKHVIKQRIARPGQGKSGGFRAFIAYKKERAAFFQFGFPKSERENVTDKELKVLQDAAAVFLGLNASAIQQAIKAGELIEIEDEDDEEV